MGESHSVKFLCVRDNLNDSVPNFLSDVVSSDVHQRQDRVDVPLVLDRELFRQDCDPQDHFLPQRVIRDGEVLQEFTNDEFRVGRVAHRIEEVESTSSNRDVLVSKRLNDRRLVSFDRLEVLTPRREMSHRVETQVSDVRLFRHDESTEEVRCRLDNRRFRVEVDREVDRFEQDCVLGVVLLNVLVSVARVLQDPLEDIMEELAEGRIVWKTPARHEHVVFARSEGQTNQREDSIGANAIA